MHFYSMKQDKTANKTYWLKIHKKPGATDFLHKGVVGDWKNFLSPEQSAQIDSICAERIKDMGLELEYE